MVLTRKLARPTQLSCIGLQSRVRWQWSNQSSWRDNVAFSLVCNLPGRWTRRPRGSSAPLGTDKLAFERAFPCRRRVVRPGTLSNDGAQVGRVCEGTIQGTRTTMTKRTNRQLILEIGDL